MAAGGPQGAGSQHAGAVSDRAVQRGGGGSVLPVCPQTGGSGGNQPQSGIHRRDETGKPCGAVYVCLAEKRGKAADQGEGEAETLDQIDHIRRSALPAGGGRQGDRVCQRQGQAQKPGSAGLGGEAEPSGAVGAV